MQEDFFSRFIIPEDEDDPNTLKLLLYGNIGTGKTYFASTSHLIEEMRPVLYADAEGGSATIRKDPQFDGLERFKLTNPEQNWYKVLKRVEELVDYVQEGGYRTLIVDTLSEVARYGFMGCSGQARDWKGMWISPETVTWHHYQESLLQTATLTRVLRDLPMHVICTAHVRRRESDTRITDKEYLTASFFGQQPKEVLGAFDEVWFTHVNPAMSLTEPEKGEEYKIITRPYSTVEAKDRWFGFPVMLDVTNSNLKEAVLNHAVSLRGG